VPSRTEAISLAPWLLVALAIPRVIRILAPYVWVEDDLLLHSAFAVSKGLRPYVDFDHAQLPLLEWVAAGYIRLVGASHVRMEIATAIGVYVTSVLVFFAGRRAAGGRAAMAASLLYAWHSLVFRYHVWAREIFVSALVLGAMLALTSDRLRARFAVAGALLFLACTIKLTAVLAVAAICVFVAAGLRAPVRAAALGLGVAVALAGFVAICYWWYGEPFLYQALLFHFLKGVDPSGGPSYLASLLDVLGPLAVLGVLYVVPRARWNPTLGLVACALLADLAFFAVFSPTAWGHNYLQTWPYVAIAAGAGVAWLLDAWQRSWLRLAAGAALVGVCLVWVTPFTNEAALRRSRYGFGFMPRAELATMASALRNAARPEDEVIAPSFIAFEANRIQAIRYPESHGVMTAGDEMRRAYGFSAARQRFGSASFFDLINETSDIWLRQVGPALAAGGRVNAVIPDSTIQLLPLVNAAPDALSSLGFSVTERSEHFALWVRPSAPVPK
jgi:hypothetical protein